jgi:hypothetical protein
MHSLHAVPQFGGRLNVPAYYESVNSIIQTLRPHATLRVIAAHLSTAGFLTPSGKEWSRERVAAYIRNTPSI